ncbi:hypothetical protein GGR56DRAFT_629641 [Xylariaceae sp. FL0804]|nr:hypothetical protein GGR56DRAFT_629641 [Xylariaceae sp. FL0804]
MTSIYTSTVVVSIGTPITVKTIPASGTTPAQYITSTPAVGAVWLVDGTSTTWLSSVFVASSLYNPASTLLILPTDSSQTTSSTQTSTSSTSDVSGSPIPSSSESTISSPNPTTTSSGTPTPTVSPDHGTGVSSGVSSGAAAGIAIATAIAGAALASVIAFFLVRRRRRHPRQYGYAAAEKPRSAGGYATDKVQLREFLLDAKPESEISTELRSLGHLIEQHVENNYHLQPVRSQEALSLSLSELGFGRNGYLSPALLAPLVADPMTRYQAIQHVIARVTFASITPGGTSPVSLLPAPVAPFYSMIPPTESYRGSRQAVEIAFTRWRQLSAFLLHPSRSDRTPLVPSEDVRTQQAQRLAVALNKFLEPFRAEDREGRYEQENHLREVIVECAAFGYLIFSQPSEYSFRFDLGGHQNAIVTCPGLVKISDEEGRRYPTPPHPVAEPMVGSARW